MRTVTGIALVGMAGFLIVCSGSHPDPGGTVSASPQTPAPEAPHTVRPSAFLPRGDGASGIVYDFHTTAPATAK